MAFSPEDLAQLAGFISQEVGKGIEALKADIKPAEKTAEEIAAARASQVGVPDVPEDAGPLYYIHLADGSPVFTSHDSTSTHMDSGSGIPVAVIGRYQVGA